MEHKYFVTFEQEIMSFPCYETELFYSFISKDQISILRIDRNFIDKSIEKEGTLLFPLNPSWSNEIDALKEILIEIFSYSGNCYGYPYFTKSLLITENEFNEILKEGINNIKKSKDETKENGQAHPLIIYCSEQNLYPEPEDLSPDSWKANCPSGRQHHIMISTSSHSWGCGYCCKKGGLEELKEWINTSKSS